MRRLLQCVKLRSLCEIAIGKDCHRRLRGVELTARGLESFSTADPPIAKRVQLPDWAHSARMVWPPPRAFDPASFAPVSFDRRLSAEWGLVQEEGRAMRE